MDKKEKKFETEILYNAIQTRYENTNTLYAEKNDIQDLILFENPIMGRILMLDGITQVTEADEFIYHEMMTHIPVLYHENPTRVLIIGGGDGGIAREVLRHKNITSVTMIEIDSSVIEFSKKYFPKVSDGVFYEARLNLKIDDGALFVAQTAERFDVIIVDSTDPVGAGAVLFTQEFYKNCHRILNKNGILVTQNGVPFVQANELKQTMAFLKDIFKYSTAYKATIPSYAFGEMAMGFASDFDYSVISEDIIKKRYELSMITTNYYTPELHKASFVLPAYILKCLN